MDVFLFDLDGTLIDSQADIAHSANAARVAVGLAPRALDELCEYIGEGSRRLIERALGPGNEALISRAMDAWRIHYERHMLDRTRVYPGIVEALGALDGHRAIVTNKPGPMARKLVEALGLARLCPVVVGGGDVAERKPDPACVAAALERLGCGRRADRVTLVGDSAIDAATARAASIPFVGVLWGLRPREELEAEGARWLAQSPADLPRLLSIALDSARFETEPENPAATRPSPSMT